jgi:hypothetical protein
MFNPLGRADKLKVADQPGFLLLQTLRAFCEQTLHSLAVFGLWLLLQVAKDFFQSRNLTLGNF